MDSHIYSAEYIALINPPYMNAFILIQELLKLQHFFVPGTRKYLFHFLVPGTKKYVIYFLVLANGDDSD